MTITFFSNVLVTACICSLYGGYILSHVCLQVCLFTGVFLMWPLPMMLLVSYRSPPPHRDLPPSTPQYMNTWDPVLHGPVQNMFTWAPLPHHTHSRQLTFNWKAFLLSTIFNFFTKIDWLEMNCEFSPCLSSNTIGSLLRREQVNNSFHVIFAWMCLYSTEACKVISM